MKISYGRKFHVLIVFFSAVLVVQLAFPVQLFALFGIGPKIPSATDAAKAIMEQFHINTESVKNFGEDFNVGDTKKYSPEVTLLFSPTDPKEGHKMTAKALPLYFSNQSDQQYFTWYLKRKGCDLGSTSGKPSYCNADNIGEITVNDWKVAAMRILVTDQADKRGFDYTTTVDDKDAYKAMCGGGNKVTVDPTDAGGYTYVADKGTGVFHQLVASNSENSFSCGSDSVAACISGADSVNPADFLASADATGGSGGTGGTGGSGGTGAVDPVSGTTTGNGGSGGTGGTAGNGGDASTLVEGQTFLYDSYYTAIGYADCLKNVPTCPIHSLPGCIKADLFGKVFTGAQISGITCTSGSVKIYDRCVHLFAKPNDGASGDGSFDVDEESYWGTNPKDPDTADNGNKDEANVVGLGLDTFAWNYQVGDQVGVVVEGVSIIPTKEDDASMMNMWAFSKNDCPIPEDTKGSYYKTIKGFAVKIPTSTMTEGDLNTCLEDNLVDPFEGGQSKSKRLEVDVSSTPENPTNDQTPVRSGDVVDVNASITNSDRRDAEIVYEWKVEISDNPVMMDGTNITEKLKSAGLLPLSCKLSGSGLDAACTGNGLNAISVTMNLDSGILGGLSGADSIYMRISTVASETYAGDKIIGRAGKGDVIVRVTNTDQKILSYVSAAVPVTTGAETRYKVTLADGNSGDADALTPICNTYHSNPLTKSDISDNLDRVACRVIKNEIVGVKVANPSSKYKNFKWTVDGKTLACDASVSNDADCTTGNEAFFAVVGEAGAMINVRLDAVDVETGKTISLTRSFNVVHPEIMLESANETMLWPRYVGQFTDIDGKVFDESSTSFFEKYTDSGIQMQARFVPSFTQQLSTRTWTIDGAPYSGEIVRNTAYGDLFGIDYFAADLPIGTVFNVGISASLVEPLEKRRALRDIWGIGEAESAEVTIGKAIQIQNIAYETAADSGVKKFYAALSGYIPPALSFAFRIILSGGLLLFAVGFLFSFVPERVSEDTHRK
jgi:uncharacterized membrane protein YgcG